MSTAKAKAATATVKQAAAGAEAVVETATRAQAVAFRSYEDAVAMGRDNVEALMRASSILNRGLQDMSRLMFGLTQQALEEGVAASRQIMGAKTLKEVIEVQTGLARAGLDKVLEEGSRLSDLSVKLAEEAFAPIGERLNAAVDRMVASA